VAKLGTHHPASDCGVSPSYHRPPSTRLLQFLYAHEHCNMGILTKYVMYMCPPERVEDLDGAAQQSAACLWKSLRLDTACCKHIS